MLTRMRNLRVSFYSVRIIFMLQMGVVIIVIMGVLIGHQYHHC